MAEQTSRQRDRRKCLSAHANGGRTRPNPAACTSADLCYCMVESISICGSLHAMMNRCMHGHMANAIRLAQNIVTSRLCQGRKAPSAVPRGGKFTRHVQWREMLRGTFSSFRQAIFSNSNWRGLFLALPLDRGSYL
jgi:hypothetical protein